MILKEPNVYKYWDSELEEDRINPDSVWMTARPCKVWYDWEEDMRTKDKGLCLFRSAKV